MQEMHETWVRSLNLKKEMATHSSVLAWRIPWTEEPGGPQFMESPFPGEGNGTQTPQFMESPFPGERNGTHSSVLAWRIPWTEEPGGPQFMESQRVKYN